MAQQEEAERAAQQEREKVVAQQRREQRKQRQTAMLRAADGLQTQLSDLEHELERLSADVRGAVAPRTGMSEKGGGPP